MAFVSGTATITPEAGDPIIVGKYLDIQCRQSDGTCLYYRYMVIETVDP